MTASTNFACESNWLSLSSCSGNPKTCLSKSCFIYNDMSASETEIPISCDTGQQQQER